MNIKISNTAELNFPSSKINSLFSPCSRSNHMNNFSIGFTTNRTISRKASLNQVIKINHFRLRYLWAQHLQFEKREREFFFRLLKELSSILNELLSSYCIIYLIWFLKVWATERDLIGFDFCAISIRVSSQDGKKFFIVNCSLD